jgi:hypothetical protein
VRDRGGEIITSAITNIDVHDIARSARTYGLSGCFVVSPVAAQRLVVDRILEHWKTRAGARRTPERSQALGQVRAVASVADAEREIERLHGTKPTLLATEARPELAERVVTFAAERARLAIASAPTLILFGTAHGIDPALLDRVERVLEPIWGPTDYNHLSVRAATANIFDRLLAPTGTASR